jgi:transcriptional regulator with XRE-family HTH domain
MGFSNAVALDPIRQFGNVVDMPRKFPNRLREWRRAAGLTLEQAAERLGTTNQSLSRKERGERSVTVDELAQIAPVYQCKPADLVPDPESVVTIREREFLAMLRGLDEADRRQLLRIGLALAGQPAAPAAAQLRRRLA